MKISKKNLKSLIREYFNSSGSEGPESAWHPLDLEFINDFEDDPDELGNLAAKLLGVQSMRDLSVVTTEDADGQFYNTIIKGIQKTESIKPNAMGAIAAMVPIDVPIAVDKNAATINKPGNNK